jgi:glucokinase
VLHEVVARQCRRGRVLAIGAGTPGTIDHAAGRVTYMQAHIPGWTGTPLARHLADAGGVPAVIDNDVNVVALGEHWKGQGRGARCLLSLALGTGFGGGIVVNGQVMRGAGGRAAEFGHMIMVAGGEACTCGNFGCVEQYTAPGAIARRATREVRLGVPSVLSSYPVITAAEVFKHATSDHLCRHIVNDAVICLARAIWNLQQIFDPDVIVIGGGLVRAGTAFTEPLRAALASYYLAPELASRWTIKFSRLGDDAGILGAARLAWNWLDGADRN